MASLIWVHLRTWISDPIYKIIPPSKKIWHIFSYMPLSPTAHARHHHLNFENRQPIRIRPETPTNKLVGCSIYLCQRLDSFFFAYLPHWQACDSLVLYVLISSMCPPAFSALHLSFSINIPGARKPTDFPKFFWKDL